MVKSLFHSLYIQIFTVLLVVTLWYLLKLIKLARISKHTLKLVTILFQKFNKLDILKSIYFHLRWRQLPILPVFIWARHFKTDQLQNITFFFEFRIDRRSKTVHEILLLFWFQRFVKWVNLAFWGNFRGKSRDLDLGRFHSFQSAVENRERNKQEKRKKKEKSFADFLRSLSTSRKDVLEIQQYQRFSNWDCFRERKCDFKWSFGSWRSHSRV